MHFLHFKSTLFKINLRIEEVLHFTIVYSVNPDTTMQFNRNLPIISFFQGFQVLTELNFFDVVLPGCSFIEKSVFYMNLYSHLQFIQKIFSPLGLARIDWQILDWLNSSFLLKFFEFNFLILPEATRGVEDELNNVSPLYLSPAKTITPFMQKRRQLFAGQCAFYETMLSIMVSEFYETDSMSKLSKTLASCAQFQKDLFVL